MSRILHPKEKSQQKENAHVCSLGSSPEQKEPIQHQCSYEYAASPPQTVSQEAIEKATWLAQALKCQTPDSFSPCIRENTEQSPNGWQRAYPIAFAGEITTKTDRLSINRLLLLEYVSNKVKEQSPKTLENLQSFGTPAIQIEASSKIRSEQDLKAIFLKLSDLISSSGFFLNTPEHRSFKITLHKTKQFQIEINGNNNLNQMSLLLAKAMIQLRSLTELAQALPSSNHSTQSYLETVRLHHLEIPSLSPTQQSTWRGIQFPNFKRSLSAPLSYQKTFGELIDQIFIAHTKQFQKESWAHDLKPHPFTHKEWIECRNNLEISPKDTLLAFDPSQFRNTEAAEFVTRKIQALFQGQYTQRYQRIPQQKYRLLLPEKEPKKEWTTDQNNSSILKPQINTEQVKGILSWRYKQIHLGLPKQLVEGIIKTGKLLLFEQLCKINSKVPRQIWGELLYSWPKMLEKKGIPINSLSNKKYLAIASFHAMGKCEREALPQLLAYTALYPDRPIQQLLHRMGVQSLKLSELQENMESYLKGSSPKLTDWPSRERFWMHRLMQHVKGSIPGRIVRRELYRYFEENPPTTFDRCKFPPPKHKKIKRKKK